MPHSNYEKLIKTDIDKSGVNQALLRRYDTESRLNGKALATRSRLVKSISRFAVFSNKPLESTTKDDVVTWLESLKHYRDGTQLKDSTINQYIASIKVFFKWFNGDEEYPECVKWLKVRNHRNHEIMEVLSPDDVKRMAECCDNQRDRALIMALYDSAGRIDEILNMRIQDVKIDRFGAVLMITGKTGVRRIRVIDAVPDLQLWLSMHPQKDDPDAPLWMSNRKKRMSYTTAHQLCRKVGEVAKVKIQVHPHLFRHSKLTLLARHLTDAELRVFAGWEAGSAQARTYIHMSGADIDDKLLTIGGVKNEDRETPTETATTPKDCPRCQTRNPPTAKYCYKCGAAVDLTAAMAVDEKRSDAVTELMELVATNPEILEALKGMVSKTDAGSA